MLKHKIIQLVLISFVLIGFIHCGKDIRSQKLEKQISQPTVNPKAPPIPTITTWAVGTHRKKFSFTQAQIFCESKGLRLPTGEELKQAFVTKGFKELNFIVIDAQDSDQDPRVLEIYYPNVIVPDTEYILPRVQIEVSCRSLREPFSIQSFGALVDEFYTDKEFANPAFEVPTVNAERTFLEKLFLLHEEFHRPSEKMRIDRLSRHLYDIYQLSKTKFGEIALNDNELYETIVKHRYRFTRVGGVNYNLHQPQTLNPLPIPEKMEEWKSDYKTMQEQMIYIDSPSFEEIIDELTKLKNRINTSKWKMESQFPAPKNNQ
jgi:hypothetical protein